MGLTVTSLTLELGDGSATQELLDLRAEAGKSPKGNQVADTRNGNGKTAVSEKRRHAPCDMNSGE